MIGGFVAESVAVLLTWAAVLTGLGVAFFAWVGWQRRERVQSRARRLAAYEAAMQETVPIRSVDGGDR